MKIDQKFRNGLRLFVQEQKAIVFPIVFLLFCDLKIPKQGIKLQFFFLNGLWRLLKNGHLPVKLHSNAPRVSRHVISAYTISLGLILVDDMELNLIL